MAQKTLIMGESGTGKSTSMRNLDPAVTAVVNPVGKPLPFKAVNGKFTTLNNETKSSNITAWMKGQAHDGKKIIVVDDFQYLLSIPYMNRIHEGGWDKWNDFGDDYFKLIDVCADLPADVRVYYLSHCETLENGITTIKLIGKLLREKITIEGLFTIVLRTSVIDQRYYFLTQNSGEDTVKSPMGMFPDYAVENDLAYIDDKICNYYEIGNFKTDAEMAAKDQEVAGDVARPANNGRRARGAAPRKSRDQVEAENKAKMDQYMADCEKAVDEIAGDREEIPYEEAVAAMETVQKPELEKLPRRTRAERQTAQNQAGIPDGQDEDLPFSEGGGEQKSAGSFPMNPPEEGGRKPRQRMQRDIQPQGGDVPPMPTDADAPPAQEADRGSARQRRVRRTRG